MIKSKEQRTSRRPVIDLAGPDGNAFVLCGYALQYAKQLGKDGKAITEEMRSGDYENLLSVFDREFGMFVDLQR